MAPTSRRARPRKKRRIPCELHLDGRVHHALVLDLSARGLFVRMHASSRKEIERGRLILQAGRDERLELVVDVVRKFLTPRSLVNAAQGGVGVLIVSAPEAYYRFLERIGATDSTPFEP